MGGPSDDAAQVDDAAQLQEAAQLRGQDPVEEIMDLAGVRDDDADARDVLADERDLTAARAGGDDEDFEARTEAASDRLDAKIDRVASRQDRAQLRRRINSEPPADGDEIGTDIRPPST